MTSRNPLGLHDCVRGALALTLLTAAGCGSSKAGNVRRGGSAGAGENGGGGIEVMGQGGTTASGSGASSGGSGHGGVATGTGGLIGSGGLAGSSGSMGSGDRAGSGGDTSGAGKTSSGGTTAGSGQSQTGGAQGLAGMTSAAGAGGSAAVSYALVTSVNGVWTSGTWTETTGSSADVTVNDAAELQTWEGFGGAFHEMGFSLLTTQELRDEASSLLFGADGARFNLARIPIGASDYALERYTLDDTGTDVTPESGESNRPPADSALMNFSIARDEQTLIPYIEDALAKNPSVRFWAAAWTPPVWMKTGYKTNSGALSTDKAKKPSYFDGGKIKSDSATLSAYAAYMVKFVQAYQGKGIAIDAIAPQDNPTFDQNYPSCLWDQTTYVTFAGQYLGPALASANLGTKIMVGLLANQSPDFDIMTAVMNDPVASNFVKSIGVEWNVLNQVETTPLTYSVPVWVTEQKVGNYPFIAAGIPGTPTTPPIPAYTEPPPNDQAYGVETWWYIRDSITKAKVTAYTFPHMVLDKAGLGNDTTREWAQNSLLVVDNGKITPTQAYYVARHFSQFVEPGAKVLTTTGGDAVAFKNPDGSLVAVVSSTAGKSDYTVAIGGKQLSFAIPAGGWATVKYTP